MILKHGFLRTENGGWVNLNKVFAITIEENEEKFCTFAVITESGNGVVIESYETKQEAMLSLDRIIISKS